jgi:hypothetical protein
VGGFFDPDPTEDPRLAPARLSRFVSELTGNRGVETEG